MFSSDAQGCFCGELLLFVCLLGVVFYFFPFNFCRSLGPSSVPL